METVVATKKYGYLNARMSVCLLLLLSLGALVVCIVQSMTRSRKVAGHC